MLELAKRFIGKECIIRTISDGEIKGIIKEIAGNSVLIQEAHCQTAVNMEYVMKISEIPRNKNGKKKLFY